MDLGSAAPATGAEWIGTAPHEALERGTRPQLPNDDPFYDAPPGFQHAAPGTVLRSRDVELAFLGLIPQKLAATQLLYRTTDMNGNPDAAATTVIVPAERTPKAVTPVISYQCAIDAVSSRCFPSYALRRGAHASGAVAQFEFLLVAAALAEGWAVSVPDHEGRLGMWGAPLNPATTCSTVCVPRWAPIDWGCRLTRRSGSGATPAADWPVHGPPRCTAAMRLS